MRLKKWLALLLAVVMLFTVTACGNDGDKGAVIAKVGDSEITEGQLEDLITVVAYLAGQDMETIKAQEEMYTMLKEDMLRNLVIFDAMRQDLEERDVEIFPEDYEDKLDAFLSANELKDLDVDDEALINYFNLSYYSEPFNEQAREAVPDEEVQEYYEANRATAYTDEAASGKVSHILVDKEELANEIYNKIMGGADFAEMAKQYGTDGTKDQGGSLGVLSEDEAGYDTDFMRGAFALKSGEVSKPVKTQFGYHIIKMEDRQEAGGVTPFEDVKDDIRDQLAGTKLNEILEELMDKYEVEYFGDYESLNEDNDSDDGSDGEDADGADDAQDSGEEGEDNE